MFDQEAEPVNPSTGSVTTKQGSQHTLHQSSPSLEGLEQTESHLNRFKLCLASPSHIPDPPIQRSSNVPTAAFPLPHCIHSDYVHYLIYIISSVALNEPDLMHINYCPLCLHYYLE